MAASAAWVLRGAKQPNRGARGRSVRCVADQNVVVIGGGVGGLATAGRLSAARLPVTLLEKNAECGGRVQSVTVDGCRWDTGPSLLLLPEKYREAFAAMGSTLEEHVPIRKVEPAAYRVFFGDGSQLDLLNDMGAMARQLERVERGAGEAFRRFRSLARRMLDLGMPNFIEHDFLSPGDVTRLMNVVPALPGINPLDLLGPHDSRLRQFFQDPRLRAMFTFQDLYVGLTPQTAPGVFSLLAGTELTDGVWYPLGGFGKVRDGLCRAAQQCGVQVRTQAEVVGIDTAGSRVTGVRLASGERLKANIVVCNRDLPAAYTLLGAVDSGGDGQAFGMAASTASAAGGRDGAAAAVPAATAAYAQQRHDALGRLQYSAGVIAYHWRLSRRLEGLSHHNVFLSTEYEAAWRRATGAGTLCQRPNFYVHCPSRSDPTAAPAGCDSVMVLLPVANLQELPRGASSSIAYEGLVAAGRQRILEFFQASGLGTDLAAAITHEFVTTPPELQAAFGLRHGAAFGLGHGLDQLAMFRPGTKDSQLRGLYFAGASTRPGNGVPLCLMGAKLTANRVLSDLGMAVGG